MKKIYIYHYLFRLVSKVQKHILEMWLQFRLSRRTKLIPGNKRKQYLATAAKNETFEKVHDRDQEHYLCILHSPILHSQPRICYIFHPHTLLCNNTSLGNDSWESEIQFHHIHIVYNWES